MDFILLWTKQMTVKMDSFVAYIYVVHCQLPVKLHIGCSCGRVTQLLPLPASCAEPPRGRAVSGGWTKGLSALFLIISNV